MAILIWRFGLLCQAILSRLLNDFDCIAVIDGSRGLGKSTLGYKVCRGVRKREFRPNRDLVYSRQEVMQQLEDKRMGVILADEMINVSYNRDFYMSDQKNLCKMLNMYRDHHNLFIMCIPNFWDLDIAVRELTTIRITIIHRGVAIIQMPKQSFYSKDKWDTYYNQKVEKSWQGKKRPIYSQLSTYVGTLRFSDLTIKQQERYGRIKERKRSKILADEGLINKSIDDPEKFEVGNMIEGLEVGNITEKDLRNISRMKGSKYYLLIKKINKHLTESNKPYTAKELIERAKKINLEKGKLGKISVRI